METDDLHRGAQWLLLHGMDWLRGTYAAHGFVVERDLVWTLRKWLARKATSLSS